MILRHLPNGASKGFVPPLCLPGQQALVDGTREKLSYSVLQSEQHIGAGFGEKKCGKKQPQ